MSKETFWVYILRCENGSLYTGYTNNLSKRYELHIKGVASKYTRSFKPLCIAQSWKIQSGKTDAMALERYIKKLSRTKKEQIIASPNTLMETN